MFNKPNEKAAALSGLFYAIGLSILIHLSTPGALQFWFGA